VLRATVWVVEGCSAALTSDGQAEVQVRRAEAEGVGVESFRLFTGGRRKPGSGAGLASEDATSKGRIRSVSGPGNVVEMTVGGGADADWG
jgi:hypothetical protein